MRMPTATRLTRKLRPPRPLLVLAQTRHSQTRAGLPAPVLGYAASARSADWLRLPPPPPKATPEEAAGPVVAHQGGSGAGQEVVEEVVEEVVVCDGACGGVRCSESAAGSGGGSRGGCFGGRRGGSGSCGSV